MPVDLSSSSADGIGATGVSFYESNVPGLANPAEWGSTVYSVASGGFSLQKFDASDYEGSSTNTSVSVNNFQIQFPLKRNKLGVSVSLAPLTQSNYRVFGTNTRIIGSGADRDTLVANVENRGDGGVNSLEFGLGWKINNNISIGYAGSLVFASIDNQITTGFVNSSYQGVGYTIQTNGYGMGNRLGTMISIPGLFGESDQLRIGAAVTLPVKLNSERSQRSDKQLSSNVTETVVVNEGEGLGDSEIELPLKMSGGITYHTSPQLSFTTEGLYEQWSEFSYGFNPQQETMFADRYKGAFGLRYFPFVTGSDKFLSRFKYRAGVSYDTGHLKIDGQKIETLLFSGGIGIPSPSQRSNSSIDISFHYGIRGTKAQNLVKESIWGMKLSINLSELMFYRPKLQ